MFAERIEVDELLVRLYTASDTEALSRAVTASAEHLRPWMGWIANEPQTLQQRADRIEEWATRRASSGDTTYGIFLGEEVVGGTGLHLRSEPHVVEIGYWVHVEHLRRAIATRVAGALTTEAFTDPTILAVEIRHDRANRRSGRVPATLGFTLVEEARRTPQAPAESGLMLRWRTTRAQWGRARYRAGTSAGDALGEA